MKSTPYGDKFDIYKGDQVWTTKAKGQIKKKYLCKFIFMALIYRCQFLTVFCLNSSLHNFILKILDGWVKDCGIQKACG